MSRAGVYGALARALAPPCGDSSAFAALGLPEAHPAELAAEHAALFGRAGAALLSPYAGVHCGAAPYEVLPALAAEGLAPDPGFRDRPDHVSVTLAAMEGLVSREERALARGDRESARSAATRARAFFDRNLRPWVPAFFLAMVRAEGFALHRSLGARAARFLSREGPGPAASHDGAPRRPALADPPCSKCGRPLGIPLPERDDLPLPWGGVCVRCRVRADLRRFSP